MTQPPKPSAERLAIELERRGAMEGHYVWPDMIRVHEAYIRNAALEEAAGIIDYDFLGASLAEAWRKRIRALKSKVG